jgi:hypothetical protein
MFDLLAGPLLNLAFMLASRQSDEEDEEEASLGR